MFTLWPWLYQQYYSAQTRLRAHRHTKQCGDNDTIRWRRRQTVFYGDRGAKSVWQENQSSSEFMLLVCLTQDSLGRSLLLSVRGKSHSLSTREWAVSTTVFLYMWYSACSCSSGTAVWFLTVMMWGFHKLTDGEGENEDKNGRWGESRKMKPGELREEFLSHSEAALDYNLRLQITRLLLSRFSPLSDCHHLLFWIHSIS